MQRPGESVAGVPLAMSAAGSTAGKEQYIRTKTEAVRTKRCQSLTIYLFAAPIASYDHVCRAILETG